MRMPLLALTSLLTMAASQSLFAAQIEVTTASQFSSSECTLSDAITAANQNLATGNCTPGNGADTLLLGHRNFSFNTAASTVSTTVGAVALPSITSEITLKGQDSVLRNTNRYNNLSLLHVGVGGNLSAENLTIIDAANTGIYVESGAITLDNVIVEVNGKGGIILRKHAIANINNSEILDNANNNDNIIGGIDYSSGASVTLTNSAITGNQGGVGCSIACDESTMYLTINQSTISNNSAKYHAGITAANTYLNVKNSIITGNSTQLGTPVLTSQQTSSITDSSISGNHSDYSSAIYAGAKTHINRSTISDNWCANDCSAGGIEAATGAVIENTTITDNEGIFGGGIYLQDGAQLINSTVIYNTALGKNSASRIHIGGVTTPLDSSNQPTGSITLANNIIIHNNGEQNCRANVLNNESHNLIIDGSCGAAYTAEPKLSHLTELANHTLGYIPMKGSITTDAGNNNHCSDKDQQGYQRSQDGDNDGTATCDLGAVELTGSNSDSDSSNSNKTASESSSSNNSSGGGGSLGWAIIFAPLIHRRRIVQKRT